MVHDQFSLNPNTRHQDRGELSLPLDILLTGGHHSVPWAPQDAVLLTPTKKPLLGPGLLLPGPRLNIRLSSSPAFFWETGVKTVLFTPVFC